MIRHALVAFVLAGSLTAFSTARADDGLPAPTPVTTRVFKDYGGYSTSRPFVGTVQKVNETTYTLTPSATPSKRITFNQADGGGRDAISTLGDAAKSGGTYAFLGDVDSSGKLTLDDSAFFHAVGPHDKVSFPNVKSGEAATAPAPAKTDTFSEYGVTPDSKPITGTITQKGPLDFTLTTDDKPAKVIPFNRTDATGLDMLATLQSNAGKRVAFSGTETDGTVQADTGDLHVIGATDKVSFPNVGPKTQVFNEYGGYAESQPVVGRIAQVGNDPTAFTVTTADGTVHKINQAGGDGLDMIQALADQARSGQRVAFLGTTDKDGTVTADNAGDFHPIGATDKVSYPNVKPLPQGPRTGLAQALEGKK